MINQHIRVTNLPLIIFSITIIYFLHVFILYLLTTIKYGNEYDMQSGCPKNMTICSDIDRLSCYNGYIFGCFTYGILIMMTSVIVFRSIFLTILITKKLF